MLRPHQGALLGAALAAFATTVVPVLHMAMLPVQYFNTHTHELCHALVGIATGGHVVDIHVFANGSGVTPIDGSIMTFTASAGYVGASLIGAAMILIGRTPEKARRVLFGLGAILALSLLLWVRGDIVGIGSGVLWAVALLWMGARLKGRWPLYIVQFLGVMQCLYSLNDLLILLNISSGTGLASDASLMQQYSHIPALFWALAWSGISVVLMVFALRSAWKAAA